MKLITYHVSHMNLQIACATADNVCQIDSVKAIINTFNTVILRDLCYYLIRKPCYPGENRAMPHRLKPCSHCRRKVRLSQKTARQRRQSHFSATVWTGL